MDSEIIVGFVSLVTFLVQSFFFYRSGNKTGFGCSLFGILVSSFWLGYAYGL